MANEVTLQTIDRVVTRSKEVSKLLSDNTVEQVFKDNQELIGYSSSILSSLEKMNVDSNLNAFEIAMTIEGASRNIERSIENQTYNLQNTIEDSSYRISSAIDVQTTILSNQVSLMEGTIKKEAKKIRRALGYIDADIRDIGVILKEQTSIQTKMLHNLDEIKETFKHPLEVESNELLERGVSWMSKGFLTESIDAFSQSIEKNPTNFLSHYYLGILYLCGQNEEDDVINFVKADEEFKLAIRYSKPILNDDYVRQYAIATHQHYSDLFYAKAMMGENPKINFEKAYSELLSALNISNSIETKKCLNSRLVKCANRTGRNLEMIQYARFGFENDYACISYLKDSELTDKKEELICALKEAKKTIQDRINATINNSNIDLEILRKVAKLIPTTKNYPYMLQFEILEAIKTKAK